MAWSTPSTWTAGAVLTAAQLNAQLRDNLNAAFPLGAPDGAWTAFTPTLVQSGAVTKTATYCKYTRVGRLIVATMNMAITGAGTTANAIVVGLPVTASAAAGVVGSFRYFDAGNTIYAGTAIGNTTTNVMLYTMSSGNALGIGPAFAAASGDDIQVQVTYEAAT